MPVASRSVKAAPVRGRGPADQVGQDSDAPHALVTLQSLGRRCADRVVGSRVPVDLPGLPLDPVRRVDSHGKWGPSGGLARAPLLLDVPGHRSDRQRVSLRNRMGGRSHGFGLAVFLAFPNQVLRARTRGIACRAGPPPPDSALQRRDVAPEVLLELRPVDAGERRVERRMSSCTPTRPWSKAASVALGTAWVDSAAHSNEQASRGLVSGMVLEGNFRCAAAPRPDPSARPATPDRGRTRCRLRPRSRMRSRRAAAARSSGWS